MPQAQVSVIIPTYNRQDSLPRAVESVLNQTHKDWDLWIVDDGSTDQTETWVHDELNASGLLNKKIFYVKTLNRGVSAARNLAINQSRGHWLAFLDSDDEWLEHKLESQLELASSQPQCPLIHGEEIWIRRGVRVNPKKKHQKSGGFIFSHALPLCCISPSTALLKRSLLNEVGLFREDFPVCEDYELWLRVTSKYPVGFVKTPVTVKYGGHSDQLSHKYRAMDYWRIKALAPFLTASELSIDQRKMVSEELIKKADILLKGYIKHNNLENYEEVSQWRDKALQALQPVGHSL